MIKILLAEDDPNLGRILSDFLKVKKYEVEWCKNGEEGTNAFFDGYYDICILDVMMPKKDGFALAKEIRQVDTKTPIIFLTAKSLKEDAIKGFQLGADDYLTKPFSMEELLLRIEAILRRTQQDKAVVEDKDEYSIGQLTFHYNKRLLNTPEGDMKMTSKEAELMKLFCEHMNTTVERTLALKRIWKDDSYFNARSMDVYLAKLRKMLKTDPSVKIVTIHGQGFKLVQV